MWKLCESCCRSEVDQNNAEDAVDRFDLRPASVTVASAQWAQATEYWADMPKNMFHLPKPLTNGDSITIRGTVNAEQYDIQLTDQTGGTLLTLRLISSDSNDVDANNRNDTAVPTNASPFKMELRIHREPSGQTVLVQSDDTYVTDHELRSPSITLRYLQIIGHGVKVDSLTFRLADTKFEIS